MSSKPSLELRQSQSLVMTQQLQLSIKLLQLSSMDLQEFVMAEVQRNPLLSVGEGEGGESELSTEREEQPKEDGFTEQMDASEESWWGDEGSEAHVSRFEEDGRYEGSAGEIIEQRHSEGESLRDHVRTQIGALITDPAERLMALYLTDLLDDSGYLLEDMKALCEALGTEPGTLEPLICRLQACEPTGVFARDLKECLRLQLEEQDLLGSQMDVFLKNLDLLGQGEGAKLAKLAGMDAEAMAEALALIRTLDPKPGSRFGAERVETLIPDILVRRGPDRQWRVEVNVDVLPRVLVNRQYHDVIAGQVKSRDDRKFVNEQLSHANWLVKALDQRAANMLKVGTEIVRWQKDFLERGIHYLKPMKLSDIAAAAGVHESTVSRISANKYMATPRGTFEMKYFFSTAVGGEEGEAQSSRVIMHEIKRMVAAESPDDILSDDTIARLLKERGMDVARRTVVKYRQLLDIPSSVDRRKAKKTS